jgi:hypothetical protein
LSPESFAADQQRMLDVVAAWPALRELVAKMTAYRPAERPSAADVRRLARELAAACPEPGLEAWASGWVGSNPPRQPVRSEGVLREDTSADTAAIDMSLIAATATAAVPAPRPLRAPPGPTRTRLVAQVMAVVATTVLIVIGFQYLRGGGNAVTEAPRAPVPADPVPEPVPTAPAVTPPPEPIATAPVEPPPTEPPPAPVTTRPPIAKIAPPPVEPPPAPVEVRDTVRLTFIFDPKWDVELVPGGKIAPRTAIEFEKGQIIEVRVNGRSCTVTADPARNRWRVDPEADRLCST